MSDLATYPELDVQSDQSVRSSRMPNRLSAWLHGQSLAVKIRLAISSNVLVPMSLAAALLWVILSLGASGTEKPKVATAHIRIGHAALSLADVERDALRMVDGREAEELSHMQSDVADAQRLLALSASYSEEEIPADLVSQIADFSQQVSELQAVTSQLTITSPASEFQQVVSRSNDLRVDMETYSRRLHEKTVIEGQRLISEVAISARYSITLAVVVAILTILLARAIIRNLTETIFKITDAMERLAKGETDVSIPGAERGDELGAMARALTVFRSSTTALRDLAAERARSAEAQLSRQQELYEQASRLSFEKREMLDNLANGFEVSVGDVIATVSAASDELRTTSEAMVELTEGSVDQSQKASTAMDSTTRNVTAAAAATDEFADSIKQISKRASASASLAREARELVVSANSRMDDLSQAAEEIDEIVELISTIAQRTNLLALNASIEAARGGEAGRGFAVVASEVKELANQTRSATNSVTDRITAMQNSTSSSVSDLNSIVDQIAELEESAVMIASAVDQKSASGAELSMNIDSVAAGSAVVGQQLGQLREASQQTGEAATRVLDSAESLRQLARDLRVNSSAFIKKVRLSSRDVGANKTDQTLPV